MHFERGYIYHVYNQGNNKQLVFYTDENYLFFLKKIRAHILPFADILVWCLMPNHFHLMLYIRETEIPINETLTFNNQHNKEMALQNNRVIAHSHSLTQLLDEKQNVKKRSLNDSIAILLRSYTRAINKQKEFSGSLWRKKTKAECINCPKA